MVPALNIVCTMWKEWLGWASVNHSRKECFHMRTFDSAHMHKTHVIFYEWILKQYYHCNLNVDLRFLFWYVLKLRSPGMWHYVF